MARTSMCSERYLQTDAYHAYFLIIGIFDTCPKFAEFFKTMLFTSEAYNVCFLFYFECCKVPVNN